MKLPRWLVVVLVLASVAGAIVAPAAWWVIWPERTARRFVASATDSANRDGALAMARDEWTRSQVFTGPSEWVFESRTLTDMVRGTVRFRSHGNVFEARFGGVIATATWSPMFVQWTQEIALRQTALVDEGAAEEASRLAIIRPAPSFELTDQAGKRWHSDALRGKVWLVSFIFTTCSGSCPATTHRMGLVERELKSRKLFGSDRIELVSITLDPARDTPEVLDQYAKLYDADTSHWSFLTGSESDLRRTIADWDMWARPAPNGQLDHPSRIFLVDAAGQVREIYNLAFMKPDWVADDVQLLLDESRDRP